LVTGQRFFEKPWIINEIAAQSAEFAKQTGTIF
jgi:hypothetical protein